MTGRLIFFTITALPESEAATSLDLKALFSNRRLIESATAVPSMMAPSTMLSGGIGSIANAMPLNPLPAGFSSTALTALDPMSSPTTDFDFPKPNTGLCPEGGFVTRKAGTSLDQRVACQIRASSGNDLTVSSRDHKNRQTVRFSVSRFHLSAGSKGRISGRAVALDTTQKGSYDLGLPLPGPARPRVRPGGKSPTSVLAGCLRKRGPYPRTTRMERPRGNDDVYVHGRREADAGRLAPDRCREPGAR